MYIFIRDFGSCEQKRELCEYVVTNTLWHACVRGSGEIVFEIKVGEAGSLIEMLANDPKLNWIEYSFQFDH